MYSNSYSSVAEELGRLHLTPQQYSPGQPKKVAPVVPPKPRGGRHTQDGRLEDYYAINAPAPGTVGVASARLNHAYIPDAPPPPSPLPAGPEFSGIIVPGAVYTTAGVSVSGGGSGGGGGGGGDTYTPPPPQPAHSYTPTARVAVPMSAQPLYSNTASQPLYNNAPRTRPVPASPQPSQPTYANVGVPSGYPHHAVYANVEQAGAPQYASYGPDSDFPLPPPPDPHQGPPPPSPPSPVSSSYSELRRATPPQALATPTQALNTPTTPPSANGGAGGAGQYATYAPGSHTSSTYESIYEPITPRPSSQMSNKSGYSVYGPYTSPRARGLAPPPSNQPIMNPDKVGKEAEVDALTNLLVKSMDSTTDPDFFGICTRCGDKVVGEGSGCTALEQVYHIKCFACIVCHLQFQGRPFYAVDSKPYCEDCYLNTLEKCCVCTKPILDRILRATGKPYHPQCFTCFECNKSLDGIPFTVDASNQIHCIDDFHKKFAPRCTVCGEPILPEPGKDETVRVVALDRSFHVICYKCEDCGLVLSSEAEGRGCYPLDGHVLCKSCNARRVQAITSKVTTDL